MADKPLRVVQLGVVPAVPAPAPAQEIAPDGYERPRRVHTGGSPKAEIDIDLLRRCHEVRMTVEEAAAFQHVSLRTLQRYLKKKSTGMLGRKARMAAGLR